VSALAEKDYVFLMKLLREAGYFYTTQFTDHSVSFSAVHANNKIFFQAHFSKHRYLFTCLSASIRMPRQSDLSPWKTL